MSNPVRDLLTTGSFLSGGWKDKYIISRRDGRPLDPEAIYFPLRLDNDPYAREAAKLYADRIEHTNPTLAADLRARIADGEEIHIRRSGYGDE